MKRWMAAQALMLMTVVTAASAATINTNDPTVYGVFATGASVEDFESVAGKTPLALPNYDNATNSSTAVPATAQLSGDISGLHFHSGGGSFSDPATTPGTPVALLQLGGTIAGDAHSGSNVIGPLEINTETLDIDNFLEIIFTGGLQNRVGVWLNPGRGNVLLTAFDATGNSLESITGTAGNFVAIQRPTNDIRFVSLVSVSASGFTADDLTYGRTGGTSTVPEPTTLALAALAAFGAAALGRRRRGDR